MWSFLVFLVAFLCTTMAVPFPQDFQSINPDAGVGVSQLIALGGSGTDTPVGNTETESSPATTAQAFGGSGIDTSDETTNIKFNPDMTDLKPAEVNLNLIASELYVLLDAQVECTRLTVIQEHPASYMCEGFDS